MAESPILDQTASQRRQGSQWETASHPLVIGGSQGVFPRQISCTSNQPLPMWLIWIPARRSGDKAELFPYTSLACGLRVSYCRKLIGKLFSLLPLSPARTVNHRVSHPQGEWQSLSATLEDLIADSPHHIPVFTSLALAKSRPIQEVDS